MAPSIVCFSSWPYWYSCSLTTSTIMWMKTFNSRIISTIFYYDEFCLEDDVSLLCRWMSAELLVIFSGHSCWSSYPRYHHSSITILLSSLRGYDLLLEGYFLVERTHLLNLPLSDWAFAFANWSLWSCSNGCLSSQICWRFYYYYFFLPLVPEETYGTLVMLGQGEGGCQSTSRLPSLL